MTIAELRARLTESGASTPISDVRIAAITRRIRAVADHVRAARTRENRP